MDFIQNHQLVLVPGKIVSRIGKLAAILLRLQIQINRRALPADLSGQSGLAHLTRPKDRNSRKSIQQFGNFRNLVSMDHPCNYGITIRNCKAKELLLALVAELLIQCLAQSRHRRSS